MTVKQRFDPCFRLLFILLVQWLEHHSSKVLILVRVQKRIFNNNFLLAYYLIILLKQSFFNIEIWNWTNSNSSWGCCATITLYRLFKFYISYLKIYIYSYKYINKINIQIKIKLKFQRKTKNKRKVEKSLKIWENLKI